MKNTMKILSRTVLIVVFGIILSFSFTTETKAETYTVSVTTNMSEIAVLGHQTQSITCNVTGTTPFAYIMNLYSDGWKRYSIPIGNSTTFGAGTYYAQLALQLNTHDYRDTDQYLLNVDGRNYEHVNIQRLTDVYLVYLIPVTITDPNAHTVTYTVANGKWDDETTANKTEPVSNGFSLGNIPNVGNKPNGGYREGSWSSPAPDTSTSITSNKTYTYTYLPITVSFVPNGGSFTQASDASATVGTDGKLSSLPTPHRDNYNFNGWFNDAAGETTAVTLDKVYTANTTLVAHWRETSSTNHTITVTTDGHGTGRANPASTSCDTEVRLYASPYEGYEFDRWTTENDIHIVDDRKADFAHFGMVDFDVTVKANFKAKSGPKPEPNPEPEPKKDDDNNHARRGFSSKKNNDDKGGEEEHSSKPAVVNPDTVEGFFAVNGQILPGVTMGKMKQGPAAQAVFNANRPAGCKEAFTFNIAINGKVDYTLKNGTFTFIIPKEYQKAGRTFAVMALDKNGKAWTFADIDTNPSTLTANINVEGYAFALIYKD